MQSNEKAKEMTWASLGLATEVGSALGLIPMSALKSAGLLLLLFTTVAAAIDLACMAVARIGRTQALKQAVLSSGYPKLETALGEPAVSEVDNLLAKWAREEAVRQTGMPLDELGDLTQSDVAEMAADGSALGESRRELADTLGPKLRAAWQRGDPEVLRELEAFAARPSWPRFALLAFGLRAMTFGRLSLRPGSNRGPGGAEAALQPGRIGEFCETIVLPRIPKWERWLNRALEPQPDGGSGEIAALGPATAPPCPIPTKSARPNAETGHPPEQAPSALPSSGPEEETEPSETPPPSEEDIQVAEEAVNEARKLLGTAEAWAEMGPEILLARATALAGSALERHPSCPEAQELAARTTDLTGEMPGFEAWLAQSMESDHDLWPLAAEKALLDCGEGVDAEQFRRHCARRYLLGPASERALAEASGPSEAGLETERANPRPEPEEPSEAETATGEGDQARAERMF